MPLRARLLLLLGLVAVVSACASPTLPLPPPGEPTVEGPDAAGIVTLTGIAQPDVLVIARNERTGMGATDDTGPDGVYVIRLEAGADDRVQIFYFDGTDSSPPIEIVIPP